MKNSKYIALIVAIVFGLVAGVASAAVVIPPPDIYSFLATFHGNGGNPTTMLQSYSDSKTGDTCYLATSYFAGSLVTTSLSCVNK